MSHKVGQRTFAGRAERLLAARQRRLEQDRTQVVAIRAIQRIIGEFRCGFDAFVIEGTPVSDKTWKRSLWFVPELGTQVRHVQQRADKMAVAELILITAP